MVTKRLYQSNPYAAVNEAVITAVREKNGFDVIEYSLEGLMLKLQYFGHLGRRANSLEKTLMLGKIKGRRRRDDRG